MTSFLIFLGLIAAIVFWAISIYNRLINERNRVRNAFAQIDVQLTRRHDLIPNLVEAVKGYMKHERETLEAVIKARNVAVSALEAAKAETPWILTHIKYNTLSGRFLTRPSDPAAVARGMYALCPDIVDQGFGEVEYLAESLGSTDGLYFWWD